MNWMDILMASSAIAALIFRKKSKAEEKPEPPPQTAPEAVPMAAREPDALYQFDHLGRRQKLVGRVLEADVNEKEQMARFGEIYNSDDFSLPDEFEFQKYRLQVKQVGFATKIDKQAPHKGRVLREVTARLVGYREH